MSWGSILGGVGSLVSSLDPTSTILGQYNQRKDRKRAKESQEWNVAAQKHFMQNSVGWRVEDARKAGINPLAALGANVHSYQPTHAFQAGATKNYAGNYLDKMGQNVQRAMMANAGKLDRELQTQILVQQLRGAKLTNDGIEIKNQQASNPQGIPPTSDPLANAMNQQGQANAGNQSVQGSAAVNVQPDSYVPMKQLGVSAATSPLKKHYVDEHGWIWNVLNQEAAESIESDQTAQFKMTVHGGYRWFSGQGRKVRPQVPIPKGYKLVFNAWMNQWRILPNKKPKQHYILPKMLNRFGPKRQRYN